MDAEQTVNKFRMDLFRKMPFYGDIVMRLPFVKDETIETACTNGREIRYNPGFFERMSEGQRNFVLMHEVFHVLLFHCKRNVNRDPELWNVAADIIVNDILFKLERNMRDNGIPFESPRDGIFGNPGEHDTVETIYEELVRSRADSKAAKEIKNCKPQTHIIGRLRIRLEGQGKLVDDLVFPDGPDDGRSESGLLAPNATGGQRSADGQSSGEPGKGGLGDTFDGNSLDGGLSETAILEIIRGASSANRSAFGSFYVPEQLFHLVESKIIKWQSLLRDFLTENRSDESSYTTPERKYIHMDLILPGYSLEDEKIEEIWAFVDSSGSVGAETMNEFLTQLWRISKEFKCIFNICYWDTEVTDVYKGITKENDILKSIPRHSGGTDINCVYRWINENRIKPDVMLILTDGYFGGLNRSVFKPSLGKKTILVLSTSLPENDDMKSIGRITRLV